MFNPKNAADRDKLHKAIQASERTLLTERTAYADLVKKYAGRTKNSEGRTKAPLVNRLQQALSTDIMLLSSGRPQFRLMAKNRRNQHFANRLQARLNSLVDEIYFEDTMQAVVASAEFKLGIAKAYRADSALVALETDVYADPGRPFIGPVSFGDYFHDMSAQRPSQFDFQGDYYDVVWERLRDSDLFDSKVADKIKPDKKNGYSYDGVRTAREVLGQSMGAKESFEDKCRLVDVWLPRQKLLITWPYRMDTPPLRVMELDDEPDCGPYKLLWYDPIPDNTIPYSPADAIERLHDMENSLWRKMAMQANQQRDIGMYEPTSATDAEAIRKARHGEWVQVKSLEGTRVEKMGGVDVNTGNFVGMVDAALNEAAGNLKSKAGQGAQSPTATQDQLISQAVSVGMAKKQARVIRFAAECGRSLMRMLLDDKVDAKEQWLSLPGFPEHKYPAHWTPDYRVGGLDDYDIDVIPYSIKYKTPEEQLQNLLSVVQNVLLPLDPAMAASGRQLRPDKLVEKIAELSPMPDLLDLYDMADPGDPGAEGDPRKPAVTTRNVNRRSEAAPADAMAEAISGMQPAGVS